MGHGWERAVSLLAFGPETVLKLSRAIAALSCVDMETKALGAGSTPACSAGKRDKQVAIAALAVTLMHVLAGGAAGKPGWFSVTLPPRVPVCLSASFHGAAGSTVSWHSMALQ